MVDRLAIGKPIEKKGWKPFPFQARNWNNYLDGKSGLLNAPTGSGKTFALLGSSADGTTFSISRYLAATKNRMGFNFIWVTPLRRFSSGNSACHAGSLSSFDWVFLASTVRNGSTDATNPMRAWHEAISRCVL